MAPTDTARRSLAVKVLLSVAIAGVVGVFAAFLAATRPPWTIGLGVATVCTWQLVKAAMDDYDRDRGQPLVEWITTDGDR